MTTEQIMQHEEIEKEVMRRYPKNEDERRGCQTAIGMRNNMRNEYRKILSVSGLSGIKNGVIE